MEDEKIIALYFSRSEQAIQETDRKYGGYCHSIAMNILTDQEDAEECVSDTYMAAWNTIPPKKPAMLNAFLGRITRYISIDRWRKRSSFKRGGGEIILALEELEDCASQSDSIETAVEKKQAAFALNQFLDRLPETERKVLLCRYWYMDSIDQIAQATGFTPSKVKSMLHRTRGKLKKHLEQEALV